MSPPPKAHQTEANAATFAPYQMTQMGQNRPSSTLTVPIPIEARTDTRSLVGLAQSRKLFGAVKTRAEITGVNRTQEDQAALV